MDNLYQNTTTYTDSDYESTSDEEDINLKEALAAEEVEREKNLKEQIK